MYHFNIYLRFRFLFWTESGQVKRCNLYTKVQLTLATHNGFSKVIKLDRTNKLVYWLIWRKGVAQNISSSEYDGKNRSTLVSGSPNMYTLGVSEDFLYFLESNQLHIKQTNISRNMSDRMMAVDDPYSNLIVLDTFLQPKGECIYVHIIIHRI